MSIVVDKIARPASCVQPYTYLRVHTYYEFHEKNFSFPIGQKKLQFVSYSEIHPYIKIPNW